MAADAKPVVAIPPSPPTPLTPPPAPASPSFAAQFPRKIFQTSPKSPASLDSWELPAIQTWTDLNPKHRYEILTHSTAESYILEKFPHEPSIYETFSQITDPILRADMIRYIVLLGDGGVYSDLDTKALKPIEKWVPEQYHDKANVVVGIEYDKLDGNRWLDWTLDLQFCTWAILAKPSHPLLRKAVDHGISQIRTLAQKQGVAVPDVKLSFHEVLDTTGPAAFTRSVFAYLGEMLKEEYTWHNLTGLTEAVLVADVLILPINAFGSGQLHSKSGKPTDDDAFVQHLFRGSWKKNHEFLKNTGAEKAEPKVEPKVEVSPAMVARGGAADGADIISAAADPTDGMNARGIRATEERTVLGKTKDMWRKIRERVEALALLYWSVGTRTGLNPGRLSFAIHLPWEGRWENPERKMDQNRKNIYLVSLSPSPGLGPESGGGETGRYGCLSYGRTGWEGGEGRWYLVLLAANLPR